MEKNIDFVKWHCFKILSFQIIQRFQSSKMQLNIASNFHQKNLNDTTDSFN